MSDDDTDEMPDDGSGVTSGDGPDDGPGDGSGNNNALVSAGRGRESAHELLQLLTGTGTGRDVGSRATPSTPKPFETVIELVTKTRVARITSIPWYENALGTLEPGMRLRFEHESSNLQDHWAIRVYTPDGALLGYVRADINEILARLMDGGKNVYGTVTGVRTSGHVPIVTMSVSMED